MSKELYGALVSTGTLHIAALSGANISIISSLIGFVAFRCAPKRLASLIIIVLIIGFVCFVGPSPSVIRAAIMGVLTNLSMVTGRPAWTLWTWVVAVSVMLVANPGYASDVSFLLSAGATLGIILFGGVSGRGEGYTLRVRTTQTTTEPSRSFVIGALSAVKRWAGEELHTTLAAQVFTIPIGILVFRQVSIVSPLTNLLIGWTIPYITVIGIVMSLAGLVSSAAARVIAWPAWLFLQYLITAVRLTSALPWASVTW